ncbi:MAG: 2-(1,2-epoxy-1,2-dihydrophenyl)acetyl-CoA isomerase PaaG [Proteobacteria bacterium]|nr:2-(1,2-epoxy-1,2-dihydrophenyl)acetyl-CoA isomerase PaaG [Pseudomonadota bacterium]MDA0844748.1 2-(1,2-epoxy-1,2-dihydrophenyl)acetyl-CoA isomerase PaaG [Pseudomonadota bacterium]
MSDTVLVESHGDWLQITLNRPDKLNCLNTQMHLALRAALQQAHDQAARAVLITGAGRGFCAGQDLGDRRPGTADWPPDLQQTLNDYFNPNIKLITSLPAPVICAVNGVAAGAGASIALACDMVLAADSASFIQSFSKIGLVPDAGSSWILPRRIGMARAMGLALTATPLSAADAEACGLIWKRYDDDALLPAAQAMADQLAIGPTAAFAATKMLMRQAATTDFETHLDREASAQKSCAISPDYTEGVQAFLDKRAPRFTGE